LPAAKRKLLVGNAGFGPVCNEADIDALMAGLARGGKRVVRHSRWRRRCGRIRPRHRGS
jgi:hypothetical protein